MGTQMAEGEFGLFVDHLGDASFNRARKFALLIADYMQRQGSFEPGILPDEDLEYGGRPKIIATLANRFKTPDEIRQDVQAARV